MMENWILVILVVIPGVWSGDWKVTIGDQCALKGTSVVIKCEYDYPLLHFVRSIAWYKGTFVDGQLRFVHLSFSPQNRIKYVGDYKGNCNLEINNVQRSDVGPYLFSFKTNWNSWMSKKYAILTIPELIAAVEPATVAEGDSVNLNCRMSPCFTPTSFVWFRDEQPVTGPVFQARREDAGRYYCAVRGREEVRSAPVALNVQYRPMNTTVLMDQSDVVEGSSVNLTCSSAANPAADRYTWYKRTPSPASPSQLLQVGSGQVLSLPSVGASHAGLYLCQARNRLGESNSTEVLLTVERGENDGQPLLILSGLGVALCVTLLITLLLFWMKKKQFRKRDSKSEKEVVFNTNERGPSYSSSEDQSNSVYANIHVVSSPPPPGDQDAPSRRDSSREIYANTSYDNEVTYSTVTIKPRNPSLPRHVKNSKAPNSSRTTAEENDDSVIYAAIVNK